MKIYRIEENNGKIKGKIKLILGLLFKKKHYKNLI